MKKFFLMCCLVAVTGSQVLAQSDAVSKTDFTAKTSRLSSLLDQGKADEAKAAWNDVHQMMITELVATKHKLHAANTADQKRLAEVMKKQLTIYSGMLKLRADMVQNKAAVSQKLSQFGNNMQ